MNKISLVTSALLLTSFLLFNIDNKINVSARPAPKNNYHKEMVYMNILLAILNDPDFLAMSYPEQYKILDGFYNHVNSYLKEEGEEAEKDDERQASDFIDLQQDN